jgi:hypothetical protein
MLCHLELLTKNGAPSVLTLPEKKNICRIYRLGEIGVLYLSIMLHSYTLHTHFIQSSMQLFTYN